MMRMVGSVWNMFVYGRRMPRVHLQQARWKQAAPGKALYPSILTTATTIFYIVMAGPYSGAQPASLLRNVTGR